MRRIVIDLERKKVRRPRGPSCSTRHALDQKAAPACACVRLSPKRNVLPTV